MKKNIKKIILKVIFIIFTIFVLRESYLIYVDYYNFKQLEKAKIILEKIPENAEKFYTLKEFNEKYNANIKPIKNCYDVSNYNWNEKYIFWFKLESLLYTYIYWENYYSYPKYNYKYTKMCVSWIWCYDASKDYFINLISNPCKEEK